VDGVDTTKLTTSYFSTYVSLDNNIGSIATSSVLQCCW